MINFRIRPNGMLVLALWAGVTTVVHADEADRRFYVSPMANYTFTDKHRGADDSVGGSMAEVAINTGLISAQDRAAMAAYLKALPPR